MSYSVVEFSGGWIHPRYKGRLTDWHVVDERGRTQRVFPGASKRREAEQYAELLNGAPPGYAPLVRQDQATYSFRPTCPRCAVICPIGSRYCNECGAFLYLTDDELAELREGVV